MDGVRGQRLEVSRINSGKAPIEQDRSGGDVAASPQSLSHI